LESQSGDHVVTEIVVTTIQDTWVNANAANRIYGSTNRVRVRVSERRGLLMPQLSHVRGRTVLSATLSGHVADTWAAQTVSIKALTSSWSAGTVTWNNQPTYNATNITSVATGALADGTQVDFDITSAIQSVANGTKWFGLQIGSLGDGAFYSTDSGHPAWVLTVELSDAPDQPADLRPDQGAVGSSRPTLAWSFTDLGGDSTEQGSLRVQVDASANGTTPAFDSGWLSSTDPQYTLTSGKALTVNTTSGSATITGASGTFDTVADVGATISGAGIPAGARLSAVASSTSATLSANATATATGVAATLRGFTALSSGASTQWRVRVKDASGLQSSWSDWASFSYKPKPTLTVDSPTGGTVGDPTFNVAAHITGETLTQWRVRVASGNDKTDIRYGSGLRDGTFALTIPERNKDGQRIIRDHTANYWVHFQAWGDVDRAPAVGDPPYVEQWVSITFVDGAVTAPDSFTATQHGNGDPRIDFTWHIATAPDAIIIRQGNDVYARLESTDWTSLGGGNYSWTDTGLTAPRQAYTYHARAIAGGVRSPASNGVNFTSKPHGVWLIRPDRTPVVLDGTAVESFAQLDRRATYKPLNVATDVDIVYGFEGISGSFSGSIQTASDQDALVAKARLEAMRKAVTERPQMIWGTHSIPVQIKNLRVLTDPDFADNNLKHGVSFDFIQDGD
jgi:hypothetical protein